MPPAITLVEMIQTAEVNNKRKQNVSAPSNELVPNSCWLIWYDLIYKHWLTCQIATCNWPPHAIEWTKFVRGVFLAETDPPCSSPQLETTVLWASAQYVCLWFVYKNLLGNEVTINILCWKIYSVIYAGFRTGLCARESNYQNTHFLQFQSQPVEHLDLISTAWNSCLGEMNTFFFLVFGFQWASSEHIHTPRRPCSCIVTSSKIICCLFSWIISHLCGLSLALN